MMYKFTFFLIAGLFYWVSTYGQTNKARDKYHIEIDLIHINKDKIKVTLYPPKLTDSKTTYIIPSVIPGSYSFKKYGRFVEEMKAFDIEGKLLPVKSKDDREFLIKNVRNLDRLEYYMNDTWDDTSEEPFIFQPGGTNIDSAENFFINHFGFYGYFKNYKKYPYELTVLHPENLYGSTSLPKTIVSSTVDKYSSDDFDLMADNPIMYFEPDTISYLIDQTRISVSVYSNTGVVTASKVSETLKPLTQGLRNFFGKLPVDKYHFLLYFAGKSQLTITKRGGFGALEHNRCSFYFLPEMEDEDRVMEMVESIAAHEFLHIITPLNLHSEYVSDFDFYQPRMSKHLWLYEGATEYFSFLLLLRENLITYKEFMTETKMKLDVASNYKDVSFTDMSEHILSKKYKSMYNNVYYKGALINFLLDILFVESTEGKMNLKELITVLSLKYGSEKPFKDDSLLKEIFILTNPQVEQFIKRHLEGDYPLPYAYFFKKIGWQYIAELKDTMYRFGSFGFDYEVANKQILITGVKKNTMKFRENDILLEINGIKIDKENIIENYNRFFKPEKPELITCKVIRKNKTILLKGIPVMKLWPRKNILVEMEKPSTKQLELRKMVLGI